MNIIKTTRTALGMSQPTFGDWLADRVNKPAITKDTVSRWESGRVAPSGKIRCAVSWIAARELVRKTAHLSPDEAAKVIQEALN